MIVVGDDDDDSNDTIGFTIVTASFVLLLVHKITLQILFGIFAAVIRLTLLPAVCEEQLFTTLGGLL